MNYQKVPFKIQPVKAWTITLLDWPDGKKTAGTLRVFDSGGWEVLMPRAYNTGGKVLWQPEGRREFSPGGDKLAMVLDNGRVYDKNQPFAIVHGGWSKPLISVGTLLNAPPQPWFSQSGVRKGVFELTAEWRGFDFPWLLS